MIQTIDTAAVALTEEIMTKRIIHHLVVINAAAIIITAVEILVLLELVELAQLLRLTTTILVMIIKEDLVEVLMDLMGQTKKAATIILLLLKITILVQATIETMIEKEIESTTIKEKTIVVTITLAEVVAMKSLGIAIIILMSVPLKR